MINTLYLKFLLKFCLLDVDGDENADDETYGESGICYGRNMIPQTPHILRMYRWTWNWNRKCKKFDKEITDVLLSSSFRDYKNKLSF